MAEAIVALEAFLDDLDAFLVGLSALAGFGGGSCCGF